jgi:putative transposase
MRMYRFRVYPTGKQESMLNSTLNLLCGLYNAMLQQRIYAYRSGKHVNYNSQQDELPRLKKFLHEYRNIHSLVVQDVAHSVDKAFDNFFRRVSEKGNGKTSKLVFHDSSPQGGIIPSHTHNLDSGYWRMAMCCFQRSAS